MKFSTTGSTLPLMHSCSASRFRRLFAAALAILIACPGHIYAAVLADPAVVSAAVSRGPLTTFAIRAISNTPLPSLSNNATPTLTPLSFLAPKISDAPAPAAAALGPVAALPATAIQGPAPAERPRHPGQAQLAAAAQRSRTPDENSNQSFFDGSSSKPKPTPQDGPIDDYHGTKAADPYRWLEDPRTAKTKAWVADQNRASAAFLKNSPTRARVLGLLQKLGRTIYNEIPVKRGDYYIFERQSRGKEQPVLYKSRRLYGPARILLDPNELSREGTVALKDKSFSPDGQYMAYGLSSNGSDWRTWRIRNVETGQDMPDTLRWIRFSGITWNWNGTGFFYNRSARPPPGLEHVSAAGQAELYFHALNTRQSRDVKVFKPERRPGWVIRSNIYDAQLLINEATVKGDRQRVLFRDLADAKAKPALLYEGRDEKFEIVDMDKDHFYALTENGAPRGRLVAIDKRNPAPENWKELIAPSKTGAVLVEVARFDKGIAAVWRVDAHDELWVHGPRGGSARKIDLPGPGSIDDLNAAGDGKGSFTYSSYTHPTTDFRVDFRTGKLRAFKRPAFPALLKNVEVKQVFYRSKDGTMVPMSLIHKKGLRLDGSNPTYLYGYGGFNISLTPEYSNTILSWVEMGGVYAVANLRGGSEFGKDWHDGGRLGKKQNVFDDFYAAAEWLISKGYTTPELMAAGGGSNGGLLVGAALTQRPDLFAAAVPQVGVLDMLRFHLFTVGAGWEPDYGSSANKEDFKALIRYSPLHNVKPGTRYPATLVMTGDHDDRVVPSHSYKFAAALQAAQSALAPILLRVARHEGHGGNGAKSAARARVATIWAFLFKVFGRE